MRAAAFLLLAVGTAAAQTQQPYSGQPSREIKALSAEEVKAIWTERGWASPGRRS